MLKQLPFAASAALFLQPVKVGHFLQSPTRNSSAESSIGAGSVGSRTPFNGESRGREQQRGGRANGFGGGGYNQPRRDMSLIGKNVRIKAGPLKAHYGIVKDATESTAMVELNAMCKVS